MRLFYLAAAVLLAGAGWAPAGEPEPATAPAPACDTGGHCKAWECGARVRGLLHGLGDHCGCGCHGDCAEPMQARYLMYPGPWPSAYSPIPTPIPPGAPALPPMLLGYDAANYVH